MSFLSGLFGGGAQPQPEQPRDHTTSADLFASANFLSQSAPQNAGPSSSSSIPAPPASSPQQPPQLPSQLPSALDTFSSAYDPARLHPLAGLGEKLDFLQLDEDKLTDMQGAASVLPSRGWTDDLCVGTGTTYVSGLAIGGAWGVKEGWSRQLGENASGKLRLNSILNGATRRGTLLGNSLGVLAIFYNLTNSGLDHIRGQHDIFNSMGAAALSGAVFKSTAGVKPAAITAGVMAGAAGAWSVFKTMI
ncbi:mitochondrial import inner membrane translocase subunit tim23 [Papiliotrema laurentii]|uniref:Mitochondrial import inner membrane translocase subunit tim23 n=1 Tax=Papiliotrema laurentii TaxID=5418 RepID=A0AAD9FUS2_PAPLA|nr:mitochondrial import inner membrane translocase subunit tim23 [Papiliotrema laurentii]